MSEQTNPQKSPENGQDLAPLGLEELQARVGETKDQGVAVITTRGETIIGISRGFPTYDNGTTIVGNSLVLEITPDEQATNEGDFWRRTIPPQLISELASIEAEVKQLPGPKTP